MKQVLREKAKELRKLPLSYREIAKQLNVSEGSAYLWAKDIPLTEEQVNILRNRNPIVSGNYDKVKRAKEFVSSFRKKRKQAQSEGYNLAVNTDLFSVGCALFWAEGGKSKNSVILTNKDYRLLQVFIKFLVGVFNVSKKDILIHVSAHESINKTEDIIRDYWLNNLELPITSFRTISYDRRKNKSTLSNDRQNEYFGICTIKVHNTELAQKLFGAIKRIANITDENLWLD